LNIDQSASTQSNIIEGPPGVREAFVKLYLRRVTFRNAVVTVGGVMRGSANTQSDGDGEEERRENHFVG